MKLIVDELAKKSKSLALKFFGQSSKSPTVRESKEVASAGGSEEGSNNEEMTFLIKIF